MAAVVIDADLSLAAVHGPARSTPGSSGSRRRCSTPPATSAPIRCARSASVIVPLLVPSIAAGSIFTFSLSLGDYIMPRLATEGKVTMIGNLIYSTLLAPNQPLAAAYTLWPLLIIVVYLLGMSSSAPSRALMASSSSLAVTPLGEFVTAEPYTGGGRQAALAASGVRPEPPLVVAPRADVLAAGAAMRSCVTALGVSLLPFPLLVVAILSFNTATYAVVAAAGFTLRLVAGDVGDRRAARGAVELGQGGAGGDGDRAGARHARRHSACSATASSAATRCRSCSCCRSPCPASSPASPCRTPSTARSTSDR